MFGDDSVRIQSQAVCSVANRNAHTVGIENPPAIAEWQSLLNRLHRLDNAFATPRNYYLLLS